MIINNKNTPFAKNPIINLLPNKQQIKNYMLQVKHSVTSYLKKTNKMLILTSKKHLNNQLF